MPVMRVPYRKSDSTTVRAQMQGKKKIDAIKAIRNMFNLGLKEAKDVCEASFFYITLADFDEINDQCEYQFIVLPEPTHTYILGDAQPVSEI